MLIDLENYLRICKTGITGKRRWSIYLCLYLCTWSICLLLRAYIYFRSYIGTIPTVAIADNKNSSLVPHPVIKRRRSRSRSRLSSANRPSVRFLSHLLTFALPLPLHILLSIRRNRLFHICIAPTTNSPSLCLSLEYPAIPSLHLSRSTG